MSKFLPSEFFAYARYWQKDSKYCSAFDKDRYFKAVHLHNTRNHHHWEYWLDDFGSARKMDDMSLVEMLCDWRAAGLIYNGKDDSLEYYQKKKDHIILHPVTRSKVEERLLSTRSLNN